MRSIVILLIVTIAAGLCLGANGCGMSGKWEYRKDPLGYPDVRTRERTEKHFGQFLTTVFRIVDCFFSPLNKKERFLRSDITRKEKLEAEAKRLEGILNTLPGHDKDKEVWDIELRYQLGLVYLELEKFKDAHRELLAYHLAKPDSWDGMLALGTTKWLLGDKISATGLFLKLAKTGQGPYLEKICDITGHHTFQITKSSGSNHSPAVSPQGDKIAFVSTRDGNEEIYIANPDGSGEKNISNHEAEDFNPVFTPSGESIIFVSKRDGNEEIYRADIATGKLFRLTSDPAEDTNPCINSKGTMVAFQSNRSGNWDIFVVGINGTGLKKVTFHWKNDVNPCFSPNRMKIAFQSDRDGKWDIYTSDFYGGNPQKRTKGKGNSICPRLISRATQFYFISDRNGNSDIYYQNEFSDLQVTKDEAREDSFAISPNDDYLAFVSDSEGRDNIYIKTFASDPKRLTDNGSANWSPVFTPDSKKIYYVTLMKEGGSQIMGRQFSFSSLDRGWITQLLLDDINNER